MVFSQRDCPLPKSELIQTNNKLVFSYENKKATGNFYENFQMTDTRKYPQTFHCSETYKRSCFTGKNQSGWRWKEIPILYCFQSFSIVNYIFGLSYAIT